MQIYKGVEYANIDVMCLAVGMSPRRYYYVKKVTGLTDNEAIIDYSKNHKFVSGGRRPPATKDRKTRKTSIEDLRLYITGKK